jgi:uncharacterized membrane protein
MLGLSDSVWGAIAAVTVALSGGVAGLYRGTHQRIAAVEKRIDTLELEVNKEFLTKADFREIMGEIKDHMIRIEGKLDRMNKND